MGGDDLFAPTLRVLRHELGAALPRRTAVLALRLADEHGGRERLPEAMVAVVDAARELRATAIDACWTCLRQALRRHDLLEAEVTGVEVSALAADLLDERAGMHAAEASAWVGELVWCHHDAGHDRWAGWVDLSRWPLRYLTPVDDEDRRVAREIYDEELPEPEPEPIDPVSVMGRVARSLLAVGRPGRAVILPEWASPGPLRRAVNV